jgi:hypothetical protein
LGFQRLAASRVTNLRLKIQKATAPARWKVHGNVASEFRGEGLDFLFLFCSSALSLLEVPMTVEKQREVIRLWNQLRKLEGPAAEELRIQILDCFSEKEFSEKVTVKRAA